MKNFVSTQDVHDALARVEKAKSAGSAARRRLSKAESTVAQAKMDVTAADEERKASEASLDQLIRRGVTSALKKGGSDMAVAIGQIIAGALEDDNDPAHASAHQPELGLAPAGAGAGPEGAGDAGDDLQASPPSGGSTITAALDDAA